MTDWDLITETIHKAMHVVDKAHTASRQLREHATPETFDNFRAQLQELTAQLNELQPVIDNQQVFAEDELTDWLNETFATKAANQGAIPDMAPGAPSG